MIDSNMVAIMAVPASDLTGHHCDHHIGIPGFGSDPDLTGLWLRRVTHDGRGEDVKLDVALQGSVRVILSVAPETLIQVTTVSS